MFPCHTAEDLVKWSIIYSPWKLITFYVNKWSSCDVRIKVSFHVLCKTVQCLSWQVKLAIFTECTYECHLHNTFSFDINLWCQTAHTGITTHTHTHHDIKQPLFPLLQNGYEAGDGAPALVPERHSQQLANVNLPDTHSRAGAPRQQQFSTACEWDWRAICWPKSLIISTSLSGGGWCMGWQQAEGRGNKGREHRMTPNEPLAAMTCYKTLTREEAGVCKRQENRFTVGRCKEEREGDCGEATPHRQRVPPYPALQLGSLINRQGNIQAPGSLDVSC